jgi:hypothetical protein
LLSDFFLKTLFKKVNLCVQGGDDSHIGFEGESNVLGQSHLLDEFCAQAFDRVAVKSVALLAGQDVFDSKNVRGATAHQLQALPCQVTYGPLLGRQNRSRGQEAQAQQVGEVTCIGLIPAVLDPFVLLDGGGIGQVNLEARRLQPIHPPIPIVSRLDYDADQLVTPGPE